MLSSTLLSTVTPPDGPIKFNQSYDVLKYISNQYHRYRLPFIVSHKDAHLNIIRSNQELELNQPTGSNKNLHENQPNRIMPTILNSIRHWDFCDSHALINSWSGYIFAAALFGFHDVTLWSIVHLWWLSVLWKTFQTKTINMVDGQIFIEWSVQIHPWKIKHILLIHSKNLHLSPFCGYYECMSNFALYLFIEALLFIWREKMVCSFKRILRRLQIRVAFKIF